MSDRYDVRVVGTESYEEWNALVGASPAGSVYSTPDYLDVLCRSAGGRFRIVGAWHGDELVGGLGLYERGSPFGDFVSPRLLLYYNGLVVRDYETRYPSRRDGRRLGIADALAGWLEEQGYAAVELRTRSPWTDVRPFQARGWTAWPSYTLVVPLADLEAQWERVEQNLRRLVERAAGEGITVAADDDFDAFFRLHQIVHATKDAPLYLPRDAFRAYFQGLRERGLCRLFHARLPGGRSVASQLVLLGPHPVSHTVSAASDPEFHRTGASALLRWRAFEALAAQGVSANDLTDASLNPVTRFKSQLGADLEVALVVRSPRHPGLVARSAVRKAYWGVRDRLGSLLRRGEAGG